MILNLWVLRGGGRKQKTSVWAIICKKTLVKRYGPYAKEVGSSRIQVNTVCTYVSSELSASFITELLQLPHLLQYHLHELGIS